MTDWSQWRAVNKPEEKAEIPQFNPKEWVAAKPRGETKENLLESALLAPIRIGADALKGGYDFLTQKAPHYARVGTSEIPALVNPFEAASHPLHRLGQVTAGALEGAQNANKSFREIPQYMANRLHLIPEEWANKIPVASDNPQWDINPAIEKYFGEPKYPGEEFSRGAARNVLGLGELAAMKQILPHFTRKGASMKLKRMRNLANEAGLNPLSMNPTLIEDTRQFLPNTQQYRNLLDAAHTGNFEDLFRLQSDLGKHATDYAHSWFSAADRAHGRAGLESRNALLDDLHDAIQAQGSIDPFGNISSHQNISGLLRSGQRDYRRFMAFRPYRNIIGAALAAKAAHGLYKKNSLADIAENLASQYYK